MGSTLSRPRVSVVVVSFGHEAPLATLLDALAPQLLDGDEVIVFDNASADRSADVAQDRGARVRRSARNIGFAAACNEAAADARGDLLVLLNPDCVPEDGFLEALREPWGGSWGGWQAMVLDGDRVNTSGGVVHFTGLAWAGEAGRPAPPTGSAVPREVGFVSGACFATPLKTWRELGGFSPSFFMYHEDVDLSLRMRLAGRPVGIVPAARVQHDYAFEKGAAKWRMLERNRWATILRCYPTRLLLLVLPALMMLELALWPVALAGGWAGPKARATADLARRLPRLLRERRAVQAARTVSARDFASGLSAELSSPYLGRLGQSAIVEGAVSAYWRAVTALLPR